MTSLLPGEHDWMKGRRPGRPGGGTNALAGLFQGFARGLDPAAYDQAFDRRTQTGVGNMLAAGNTQGAARHAMSRGALDTGLYLQDRHDQSQAMAGEEERRQAAQMMQAAYQMNEELLRMPMEQRAGAAQQMAGRLPGIDVPAMLADPNALSDEALQAEQAGARTQMTQMGLEVPQVVSGGGPLEINDQLVDPSTYQVLGDYRDPQGSDLPTGMRMGANGQPEWIPGYLEGRARTVPQTNVTLNTGEPVQSLADVPIGQPIPEALLGGVKIEQGMVAVRADNPLGFEMMPVPGGSVERSSAAANERRGVAGGTVVQDLGRALELLQGEGLGAESAAGPIGGQTRFIPGSPAHTVDKLTQSALSNIGIEELQKIRDASPTGGALGQIPVQQQKRLEQMLGSLDLTQPDHIIENNIKRIMNIYNEMIHGVDGDGQTYNWLPVNFDSQGRPLGPPPSDVGARDWFYMAPEDRALWDE